MMSLIWGEHVSARFLFQETCPLLTWEKKKILNHHETKSNQQKMYPEPVFG